LGEIIPCEADLTRASLVGGWEPETKSKGKKSRHATWYWINILYRSKIRIGLEMSWNRTEPYSM